MAALVMIWLVHVCSVVATQAAQCPPSHHCTNCSDDSGVCLTECHTGYYDQKCNSSCSKNCRNKTCVLSNHGNDNCTYGCVPGFQSIGCNIPCDNPGGGCTACPGGCDGGYCQLGSSCVFGCVGSYYGTDCKSCSSGCTSCNRVTGSCESGHRVGLELYVGLSLAAGLSLMINLILCCEFCRHHSRKRSVPQTKETCSNVAVEDDAPVAELEWYTYIPLTDMSSTGKATGGNCGGANEATAFADDVYDVAVDRKEGFPVVLGNIYSKLSSN